MYCSHHMYCLYCPVPQALAVNEFHNYPGDFYFTAPLNTSALPPLRITGDGVLQEFGFNQVCMCLFVIVVPSMYVSWYCSSMAAPGVCLS